MITEGTERKNKGFQILGFKETLFNSDETKLVKQHKINNFNMYRILFNLLFIEDGNGHSNTPISYSQLTPEQIGTIYEGMLEYKMKRAKHDMIYYKKGNKV